MACHYDGDTRRHIGKLTLADVSSVEIDLRVGRSVRMADSIWYQQEGGKKEVAERV